MNPTRRSKRPTDDASREQRRLRIRRHGRRAYIRSVYSLPSLATLGNAVCGFAAMYVATLDPGASADHVARFFAESRFIAAAYLLFGAMVFDALDGRLARFARHTTDFGGQLDSLADVISFGAAPAFLALLVFRDYHHDALPPIVGRCVWAISALYMSCAALRLARFNVSNKHGEQHHFSFLGLPSPGAAGAVAALILMQQDLAQHNGSLFTVFSAVCVTLLPLLVLLTGLLMVSAIRYPHIVNRYLRGKRSIDRLVAVVILLLLLVVAHRYTLGIGTLFYVLWGLFGWGYTRLRSRGRMAALRTPAISGGPISETGGSSGSAS